jgi:hypothetical protein
VYTVAVRRIGLDGVRSSILVRFSINTVIAVRLGELVDDYCIVSCSLLGGELVLDGVIVS